MCSKLEARTVVLDFGHNPSAIEALVEALGQFPHERRTLVLSADGDRRDEVIVRQAEILGAAFDHVILYEEHKRNRGRSPGEIITLLRRGLAAAPRMPEVREIQGELAAIETALGSVGAGDLLLILHDAVDKSLAFVQRYLAERDRNAARANGATTDDAGPAPRGFREVRIVNQGH